MTPILERTSMVEILEMLMKSEGPPGEVVLRPNIEPGPVLHPIISVDDHLIEPPDLFTGRLPSKFIEFGPHILRKDGVDYWIFEGKPVPVLGQEGIRGWEHGKGHRGPIAFEQFRPGVWKIDDRIGDMDVAGIIASLNFPSAIFGFAGQRFMRMGDQELGLASMRAYNDWIIEAWGGSISGSDHSLSVNVARRCRTGRRRDSQERRARVQGGGI